MISGTQGEMMGCFMDIFFVSPHDFSNGIFHGKESQESWEKNHEKIIGIITRLTGRMGKS